MNKISARLFENMRLSWRTLNLMRLLTLSRIGL